MTDGQPPIVETVLSDVAAIVPQFSSIVGSYRLLVGAAEELNRTKGVCAEVVDRAVIRADRAGALIDMLLEILCTKLSFSTNFLAVSAAPVDVFRLVSCVSDNSSRLTAEQIIELEALRQILCRERSSLCFAEKTAVDCVKQKGNGIQPQVQSDSDIVEILETETTGELGSILNPTRNRGDLPATNSAAVPAQAQDE